MPPAWPVRPADATEPPAAATLAGLPRPGTVILGGVLPLRTATGRLGDSRYLRVALIALALILTPLAAGVLAVFLAPPAHVNDVGLDGLDVDVRLVPGGGSTQLDS